MMYVQVLGGFILLLGGAEFLVRGAVGLSSKWGVSTLVIGMTVVAFGTSAPEFVVSLDAALSGVPAMALGNVVGSNIANVLLILGAAGLIMPIVMKPRALLRDGIMLLGGTVLFGALCGLGEIGLVSGGALLVVFALFLANSYFHETRGDAAASAELHIAEVEEFQDLPPSYWIMVPSLIGGMAAVIYGADLLVEGGSTVARSFGVSEEVIGLTLIAFGTSLPELAASMVAAFRGHAGVALGNVVGSNLFNILAIVGGVAVIVPLPVPDQIQLFDLWVMLGATVVLMPFLLGARALGKAEAMVFLVGYFAYIAVQAYGVPRLIPGLG
ncbi:MAG: calcium/sodium antiporter [Rhodospirillales bacterium]|nr:calcium/sodium antiporter [Rhodospirillales bacterium]